MKALLAGLGLSLLAGVAMAQGAVNPPAVNPPPALPDAGQNKAGLPEGSVQEGAQPMPGRTPGASAAPDGYEGMIVQTPQGAYMVTEPDEGPEGPMPPGGMQRPGEDGMMGRPPRGGRGHMGGPVPPGKAARFNIRSGDMEVGVSCAPDEPMKNCIEAMSELLDKVGSVQHH